MRLREIFFGLSPRRWLLRVLQGALVGSGAILPGISGGVLCVSFGLYQPMMSFFAHPRTNFRTSFPQLFPAGVGVLLGFIGFARLVSFFFAEDADLAIWLFIGLIAGSVPGLWRQAGEQGRSRGSLTMLLGSFLVMLAAFFLMGSSSSVGLEPGWLSFFICGIMWGLSMVVPGMTSSSVLIFLGIYEPMTAGIAELAPGVLAPMVLGVLVTIVGMARLINRLFEKHYAMAFHAALGFVLASTVAIVPTSYTGVRELIFCLLAGAFGFAVTFWLDRRQNARPGK